MKPSLTVLVPVHNVQSTLADIVLEALEVVADSNDRFELLIIDDGSVDATCEVAMELAWRYPQVRSIRHGDRRGPEAAIRTGVAHSRGDVILLREEPGRQPCRVALHSGVDYSTERGVLFESAGTHRVEWRKTRFIPPRGYRLLQEGVSGQPRRSSQPARPNYLGRTNDMSLGSTSKKPN